MLQNPAFLFALAIFLAIALGLIIWEPTSGSTPAGTWFVMSIQQMLVIYSVVYGLVCLLMYPGLEWIKRPISPKTGYWHFGFFAGGVLFALVCAELILATQWQVFYYGFIVALILEVISLIVFIFGISQALRKGMASM